MSTGVVDSLAAVILSAMREVERSKTRKFSRVTLWCQHYGDLKFDDARVVRVMKPHEPTRWEVRLDHKVGSCVAIVRESEGAEAAAQALAKALQDRGYANERGLLPRKGNDP